MSQPRLAVLALTASALAALGASSLSASAPNGPAQPAAQDPAATQGVTVVGHATYELSADRATVRLRIAESEEMAGEALESLLNSGTRLVSAIESIESGAIRIERSGQRFGKESADSMQAMMIGMDTGADEEPKVETSEIFTLHLSEPADGTGLPQLIAEVLEAATDAGATLDASTEDPQMALFRAIYGQEDQQQAAAPPIQFHAADAKAARSAALKQAMAAARAEGSELAGLAGLTLGRALSIRPLEPAQSTLDTAGTRSAPVSVEVRYAIN